MRIIDAFWEKRNLGVAATEIICAPGDDPASLAETLSRQNTPYQVLKIPVGEPALYGVAHGSGFKFAETQMEINTDLRNFSPGAYLSGKLAQMSYAPMDEADKKELDVEFEKGIFHTDRIALDPCFSIVIANRRYKNWLEDALARGGSLYKIIFANAAAGFFAFSEPEKGVGSAFLCGLYSHSRGQGLGGGIIYFPLLECSRRGLFSHTTHVSLNNPPILNLHLRFQASIGETSQVFIKHLC